MAEPLDYDLDNYQNDYDNTNECSECGKEINENQQFCSRDCYKANQY